MADAREVKVRVIADIADYEVAMKRARRHAKKLAKALREISGTAVLVRVDRS